METSYVLILMLASSLCMYSAEHDAQPTGIISAGFVEQYPPPKGYPFEIK